jgi:hypothetical protein
MINVENNAILLQILEKNPQKQKISHNLRQ